MLVKIYRLFTYLVISNTYFLQDLLVRFVRVKGDECGAHRAQDFSCASPMYPVSGANWCETSTSVRATGHGRALFQSWMKDDSNFREKYHIQILQSSSIDSIFGHYFYLLIKCFSGQFGEILTKVCKICTSAARAILSKLRSIFARI